MQLLIDKWPLLPRLFFALFGAVLMVIAVIVGAQGAVAAAGGMILIGLVLMSLIALQNRVVLDSNAKELQIRFRWVSVSRCHRIPLAAISEVYVRSLGKGSCEVGLRLKDDGRAALCRPMGSESDKEEFARRLAASIGVPLIRIADSQESKWSRPA